MTQAPDISSIILVYETEKNLADFSEFMKNLSGLEQTMDADIAKRISKG